MICIIYTTKTQKSQEKSTDTNSGQYGLLALHYINVPWSLQSLSISLSLVAVMLLAAPSLTLLACLDFAAIGNKIVL